MAWLRLAALLAALLGALCATSLAAQGTLTPQEARLAAGRLLAAGQPRAAAQITDVLIRRDRQDAAALILHAHALRNLADFPGAQRAARKAWRASSRPMERYGAALAMAQALSSEGKKTRAQFWLRRAADVAPTPQLKARAGRDYRYLRITNPWSVNFSFGISPGDNVNNAPRDNTIVLGGLIFEDPTAVALSGIDIHSDLTLRYNFAESRTRRSYAALRWSAGEVILTDDDVPAGVDESDFSYRRLEAQYGIDFQAGPKAPRQNLVFSFGRTWGAGDPLADEVKIGWSQLLARPEGRQFGWNGTLGYSWRKDNDLRSGVTATLGMQALRPLAGGGTLSWNAGLTRTDTSSRAYTHTRLDTGVAYALPRPVLGAQATLSAQAQLRLYDDALYIAAPREDRGLTLSASFLFVDFDTLGFAPKITLEARETRSNVTRFETRNFGLKIGFQSVF